MALDANRPADESGVVMTTLGPGASGILAAAQELSGISTPSVVEFVAYGEPIRALPTSIINRITYRSRISFVT